MILEILLLIPSFIFLISLLGYHTYILMTNQTTNENLKSKWKEHGLNPYKRDCCSNFWFSLMYPIRKSFLSMRIKNYTKQ